MKKQFIAIIFVLGLIGLGAGLPVRAATIIRAPEDYSTIQAAINAASYGDQVRVSADIYYESIIMKPGVDVIGTGAEVTTISSSGTVVTGADEATIRGFTITGGSIGIYANNVSGFSIFDNVVTDISNPDAGGSAEGIYITNSDNVRICSNKVTDVSDGAWGIAAGIYLTNNSSLTVYGNTVSDIRDYDWDAAFGIFDSGSTGSVIVGNIIYGIRDSEWASAYGIYENGSLADVSYNTVVLISEDLWDNAYGVYNSGSGSTVSNNIVAYVSEADWGTAYGIYNGSDTPVSYNDVWNVSEGGGWPGPGVDYYGLLGEGNLMVDPLFVNLAERDFHLQAGSPLLTASEFGGEIGAYGAPCLYLCAIPATIDIKPGSCPNPLRVNFRGKGILPVAILGSEDFNVFDIDITTITLEGVAPIRSSFEDVSTPFDGEECECSTEEPDGIVDLVLKFDRQEILAALENTYGDLTLLPNRAELPLTLTAMLIDEEVELEGTDCLRILNRGAIKRKK